MARRWFEVFEAMRRLMLTGMLVLCYPGSISQILVGMGIAFVSMRIFTHYAPYVSPWQGPSIPSLLEIQDRPGT
jgi:hypothetical protein